MNIESIESQYGTVSQDHHTGKIFNDGRLVIVGFAGKFYPGRKRYVVKCSECTGDEELHGDGHFTSTLCNLVSGNLPCGCGKNVSWTKEQYYTLCSRKADELGYKFKGFSGEWVKCKTKVILSCEKHSEWSTGNIANLLNLGNGCPRCKIEQLRLLTQLSDVDYIEAFMKTGSYKLGTSFIRSGKINTQGRAVYWQITCPICNETHIRSVSNLMEGKVPCSCRLNSKKSYSYIMLLSDDDKEIAIKFGITSNLKGRINSLNSKNTISASKLGVWEFSSRSEASNAEKECTRELHCGIISKIDMQDGYTETTYCYNIDKIIEIYEKHNGKCIFYMNEEKSMPELEQDTLEEIMSYSESYIQCELGSDLTTLLLGEMNEAN